MNLTSRTNISIEFVTTLLTLAASWGAVWAKLDAMDNRLSRMESKVFPVAVDSSGSTAAYASPKNP